MVVARLFRSAAAVETALIATGLVVFFFLLPHTVGGDDLVRFHDIEALKHGHISKSPFSLVMPLVSTPVLALGDLVRSPIWWAARFNVIVVAVGALVAFRLLRDRVEPALLRRTLLALLFASYLTQRLRDYDAEVLTTTLVALGIVCIAIRRHVVAGWAAIVVGVVNQPAAIVGLALLGCAVTLRTRRLRHLLPVLAAAALIMAEAWIRRGGPLVTGYEGRHGTTTVMPYSGRPGFSYPFLFGVMSILFSFGRGLLFFTPGLALWLGARTRRLADPYRSAIVPMLLFVAGLVLVYAKWWAWYGGLAWGPRFFVFAAVPASLLLALRLRDAGSSAAADAVALAVLALSGWVAVDGAIEDNAAPAICSLHGDALAALCWYTPEYSSLWHPLVRFPGVTTPAALAGAYCLLVIAYLAAPLVASLARGLPRPAAVRMRF